MCVVGATYSFGAVLSDVMVVKTNADGDTLWLRTFGGPDYEFGDAVCTTSDGSCVIAGQVIPSGGGNADVYIVKVNAGGGKVWEKTYGGPWSDYGQAICQTDDGGYMVVGTTESYGAGGSDVYALKIDASGDTVWTRAFGGPSWDGGASVVQTYDHHYVIGGYYTAGDTDIYLVMIDTDGNEIWSSTISSGNEDTYSIATTDNGGLIAAGTTDAFGDGNQAFLMRTMGAFPVITGIADIPADQGGQVRVSWYQSSHDDRSSPVEITDYSIWRRIDSAPAPGRMGGADRCAGFLRLGFPPGSWDYVTTVPARGEREYNCVVPTLCDSTAAGRCMSCFFVSAETADPLDYYDSAPDSGYSVDNLAPSPPAGLHMESETELAWEESPEEDFDYFTVYGSDDGDFQAAVFIGYTIDIHLDVSGDAYAYYHVTATDFAGNEGEPATTDNTFAGVAGGSVPAAFALGRNTPNPFAVRTEVAFEVPSTARVSLQVVDVGGRVVRSLVDRTLAAGRYSVGWDGRDGTGREMGPGVYFVRMAAGEFSATRKMMLIK